ncbi:unnamed protein product [Symbiodinium necroappetens]|uniref:Uncharacterized protein n=1 Tax=Symbiodinium necroappetens TaxID=1628268 RepID=A0A812L4I4_9DINO|nr:unnamed protein product [Symbiodinium necroappetens]
MGGKRGWGRGGGNGYASSSWNDKQGKWGYWRGAWSPRQRAEEERYDQVQLRTEQSDHDPRDAGGGKTAFLLAVQKAVTLARRHDVKLRKLNEEQENRQKLWKQYVEDTKRKFAKQKREFEADIQRLEADKISTLEAGQMAAAQVKAIIVGQSRPSQAAPPLDPNEAWATLWQSTSAAPSGATFLDDAMTAAAMCGMDVDFPSWEEGLPQPGVAEERADRNMGPTPARETDRDRHHILQLRLLFMGHRSILGQRRRIADIFVDIQANEIPVLLGSRLMSSLLGTGEPPPPASTEETTAEEARRIPILEYDDGEEAPDFE